jgi:adenylyltransferase/sulfurtransferase
MGVGFLRLIDQDVIDITNLHRQILYDTESIGFPKVEIAEKKLKALNPNITIEAIPLTINEETAEQVVKGMDVVVDGLDRFAPRYALNKACVKHGVPYIHGGALETYGNVSTIIPRQTACLECYLGNLSDEGRLTCETAGVLPSVLATIASIQASETVHLLLGQEPALRNRVLFIDLHAVSFTTLDIVKREDCPTCGVQTHEIATSTIESKIVELCGKDSYMASPRSPLALDLSQVATILQEEFTINRQSNFGIAMEDSQGISINLMKTGNALIKGVSDMTEATRTYNKLLALVSNVH